MAAALKSLHKRFAIFCDPAPKHQFTRLDVQQAPVTTRIRPRHIALTTLSTILLTSGCLSDSCRRGSSACCDGPQGLLGTTMPDLTRSNPKATASQHSGCANLPFEQYAAYGSSLWARGWASDGN